MPSPVFADVSKKSRPASVAYAWASSRGTCLSDSGSSAVAGASPGVAVASSGSSSASDELVAPGDDDDALVVERRHEVLPAAHLAQAREVGVLRALEHVGLDRVEQLRDGLGDVGERGGRFGAGVAADGERLGLGEVLGADLEAEGDTLCNDDKLATGSVGT